MRPDRAVLQMEVYAPGFLHHHPLHSFLKKALVKFFLPHDLAEDFPYLRIRVIHAVAGHAAAAFGTAVPVEMPNLRSLAHRPAETPPAGPTENLPVKNVFRAFPYRLVRLWELHRPRRCLPYLCLPVQEHCLKAAVREDGKPPDRFPESLRIERLRSHQTGAYLLELLFGIIAALAGNSLLFLRPAEPAHIFPPFHGSRTPRIMASADAAFYLSREKVCRIYQRRPSDDLILGFVKNLAADDRRMVVFHIILRELPLVFNLVLPDGVFNKAFLVPAVTNVNFVAQDIVQMTVGKVISPP